MANKIRKTNTTAYLPLDVLDCLDELKEFEDVSRNSLFEEAVYDLFEKRKSGDKDNSYNFLIS